MAGLRNGRSFETPAHLQPTRRGRRILSYGQDRSVEDIARAQQPPVGATRRTAHPSQSVCGVFLAEFVTRKHDLTGRERTSSPAEYGPGKGDPTKARESVDARNGARSPDCVVGA